jgi:hypothetical protein
MIGARTVKAQFFAVPYFCSLSKESPANRCTMHVLDRFSRIGLGWAGLVVSAGLRDCGIAGASTGSQFLGGRGVCGAGVCLAATRERLPEVVARLGGDGYETLADFPGWEPMFGYRVLQ